MPVEMIGRGVGGGCDPPTPLSLFLLEIRHQTNIDPLFESLSTPGPTDVIGTIRIRTGKSHGFRHIDVDVAGFGEGGGGGG
jgi:hypothetical protein